MASNRNKLVSLTDYVTGAVFMVSSCQIISFKLVGVNDTSITYIDQRGNLKEGQRVTETVAAINTACISNGINMMIPVTLDTGIVLYLNIDRVIYVDSLSNSSPLVTAVTYDAGVNQPAVYKCSLPTPANFNSATDNTFGITTQATSDIPSRTRYINNEKIAMCATEEVGDAATLVLKMKPESYTVTAAGTGYTSAPSVAVAGTGGSGSTATATLKLISSVVAAAGTGYVQGDTITLAGGTSTTTAITTVATTKVVTTAVNAAGTGYVPGDTITLAGGTFSTAAILTVLTTKVVSATVAAGGTGDLTNGAGVIVEGTTGTGTKFRASVTIAANAIASVQSITIAGSYTVNPTLITSEPVTYISGAGGGTVLTGATLSVVMGVLTESVTTAGSYTVNTASFTQSATSGVGTGATFNTAVYGVNTLTVTTNGVYTVLPSNPIAQASTSGVGTGATLTGTWGVNTVVLGAAGAGYTAMPTVTISGGGGTGATATAVMEGDVITVTDGGSGYTTVPTLSFTGGGGTLLAATVAISLVTEAVTSVTVTVAGGGYTSFPTMTLSAGEGAFIIYNELKTEYIKLQVAETIATLQSAVAAL